MIVIKFLLLDRVNSKNFLGIIDSGKFCFSDPFSFFINRLSKIL